MKVKDLQDAVEKSVNHHQIAGASVAVFSQGELTCASAGITNITTGVPVTTDTVMHIGSIAKVFTATLIMQLVDEGLVKLDTPILQYLPELKLKDLQSLRCITVKMLLNHTSGIDGEMLPDQGHDQETIEKGIARFSELGQLFTPGTENSYCNAAVVIAGYLAQKITRKSWYDLIKEKIYAPLGMQHAVTLPAEALLHRASVGHHFDQEKQKHVRTSFSLLPLSFSPGGTSLMMSAKDLVTFARVHIANGIGPNGTRILSESSAKAMQQQTVLCEKSGYSKGIGLGWKLYENGFIGHGGGAPGVLSQLYVFPESGFVAAVLTNSEHGKGFIKGFMEPWINELADGVSLYGQPSNLHPSVNREELDTDRYIGTYEDVSTRYTVTALRNSLGISSQLKFPIYDSSITTPAAVIPLSLVSDNSFIKQPIDISTGCLSTPFDSSRFSFKNPDSTGRMEHLVVSSLGRLYRRMP